MSEYLCTVIAFLSMVCYLGQYSQIFTSMRTIALYKYLMSTLISACPLVIFLKQRSKMYNGSSNKSLPQVKYFFLFFTNKSFALMFKISHLHKQILVRKNGFLTVFIHDWINRYRSHK